MVPTAEVVGETGRRSSFEVTLNGALIWSKLDQGAFPDFHSVSSLHSSLHPPRKEEPVQVVVRCQEVAEKGSSSTPLSKAESSCVIA